MLKKIMVVLMLGLWVGAVYATVPQHINVQGRVLNDTGQPVVDAFITFKFDDSDPALSTSPSPIQTDSGGIFNAAVNLRGQDLSAPPHTLAIYVNGVQYANQPLQSVPYALRAAVAEELAAGAEQWGETAGGVDVYRGTGKVGVGTDAPAAKLEVVDSDVEIGIRSVANSYGGWFSAKEYGVHGQATNINGIGVKGEASDASVADTAINFGGFFSAAGRKGMGVLGVAIGDDGQGVRGEAFGRNGRGISGKASAAGGYLTYGGYFSSDSNFGVGVLGRSTGASPAEGLDFATGVRGEANDASEDTLSYGGYFTAAGGKGTGIYGQGKASGVHGDTGNTTYVRQFVDSDGGFLYDQPSGVKGASDSKPGVVGISTANAGVFGASHNYGVRGYASALQGVGVVGLAGDRAAGSQNIGGHFTAWGGRGRAVFGEALASGPKVENYGGYFQAAGKWGRAVYGEALEVGATGANNVAKNYGGYFVAKGNEGRAVYGLSDYDSIPNSTTYGGYFEARSDQGRGVYGKGAAFGVEGHSDSGVGVKGESTTGVGVYGSTIAAGHIDSPFKVKTETFVGDNAVPAKVLLLPGTKTLNIGPEKKVFGITFTYKATGSENHIWLSPPQPGNPPAIYTEYNSSSGIITIYNYATFSRSVRLVVIYLD